MLLFKKLLYITLSIILMSVSVNMFLAPHSIAAGGITGLGVILETLLSLNRAFVVLVSNMVILIITFIFLDRQTFYNTVTGAAMLPVFIGIIPNITLVNDTMLSMAAGSVMFGIAVSVLYNNKASSGGTSIPPLIMKKYFNLSPSIGLFFTDGVVVVLCLLVFSVDSFFYAVTSIFITSLAMNYMENGINKKKMVYIISDMNDSIIKEILHDIGRGITVIPVMGGYKKNEKHMLMVTLDTRNYQKLLSIVNKHDEQAFMITDTVSDVHGQGFPYESGSV